MRRQEFMRELEYLLRAIPDSERVDALAYYNDYFDEAGEENEAQVIRELGSPQQVADKILAECGRTTSYKKVDTAPKKETNKSSKILLILLLIFTFPLWIGVVGAAFGIVVAVLASIFGIVVGFGGTGIGLLVGGGACLVAGLMRLMTVPVEGLVTIAVGSILIVIGVLLALLVTWLLFKWIPGIGRAIIGWFKGLRKPQRGGNEI